jgi:hypothetical protein
VQPLVNLSVRFVAETFAAMFDREVLPDQFHVHDRCAVLRVNALSCLFE